MLKTKAAQPHVLNKPAAVRIAQNRRRQTRHRRSDDFGSCHIFAGKGNVEQIAVAVEKPFARRIRAPGLKCLRRGRLRGPDSGNDQKASPVTTTVAIVRIDRGDAGDRILPQEVGNDHGIVELALRNRGQAVTSLGSATNEHFGSGSILPVAEGHRPAALRIEW